MVSARRILLLAGGGLGNLIHATPAIEAIRSLGCDLTVWVGEAWPEQARFIDHDQVVTGPVPDPKGFDRAFRTPFALTGHQAHLAAQYEPLTEASIVPSGPEYTEVESNFFFARVLGYDGLMPPPAVRHATDSPIEGDYVVIAPGVQFNVGAWLKKCYPFWPEVAQRLFDKSIAVVFVGHANDSRPEFGRWTNLCGRLGLWESSGVLHKAGAVVGPDNGLTALSAAMGRPTVVLWGPTSETKNRKFGPCVVNLVSRLDCRPCQFSPQLESCVHANCMRVIPPTEVAEAVLRVFARREA